VVPPNSDPGNLIIINDLGQIVFPEVVKSKTKYTKVSTGKWQGEIYLIKWQGENGNVLATKLIKY
jgi:hypothetical protein